MAASYVHLQCGRATVSEREFMSCTDIKGTFSAPFYVLLKTSVTRFVGDGGAKTSFALRTPSSYVGDIIGTNTHIRPGPC